MLSLWDIVESEAKLLGNQAEKRPSRIIKSDPKAFSLQNNIPLAEKVVQLLNSSINFQICWALSNVPRLVSEGSISIETIKFIPHLYETPSAKLEQSAARATLEILKIDPDIYKPIFLEPLLKRIQSQPVVEYMQCIQALSTALTEDEVTNHIWPIITSMMKMTIHHQHCALSMLLIIDPELFNVQRESFDQFINYPLFINEYLSKVAELFHPVFGDEWIYSIIPQKLFEFSQKDESYRNGFVRYISQYPSQITLPTLYSMIIEAFNWAKTDLVIALDLLSHADEFMGSRYQTLASSILSTARSVANSPDPKSQLRFLPIFLQQDYLLNGIETTTQYILEVLGRSENAEEVQVSFINNAHLLYHKLENQRMKELVLKLFALKFTSQSLKVKETVALSPMIMELHVFGGASSARLIADLANYFYNRWRFFSRCLQALELYAVPILIVVIKTFLPVIQKAVELNPQALTKTAIDFYTRFMRDFTEEIRPANLLKYLWTTFGKSNRYDMRRFYVDLSMSYVSFIPRILFEEEVWCHFKTEFLTEKVPLVKARILQFLISVNHYYDFGQNEDYREDSMNISNSFNSDVSCKDPQVSLLIDDLNKIIEEARTKNPMTPTHSHSASVSIAYKGNQNKPVKPPPIQGFKRPVTPKNVILSNTGRQLVTPRTRNSSSRRNNTPQPSISNSSIKKMGIA
ncbi:hypothetical protein TVAG_321580 [Trichomonas vaginalis G3]|uniref:Uncharacterized protein n=1 Tax=Trichomonas vaginalis (strain ATCC PRA-98 / G3) TaxID=412133 RepID=A2FXY2_TRIV3|nr:armadillo (ARM) repeat-containing protein family [Trichomonas vaginalis G3]EAX90237.1 hypothetical protein TVAG_321580 [Trichomonas vaginalis G3]KAI5534978.1 armadillo (ARM) repeat-containing protein family [Trichomonas vaginalis G3]|eukprot:XP_001303167.1 hypothetical protein [Trichomonas vaginalis G3]